MSLMGSLLEPEVINKMQGIEVLLIRKVGDDIRFTLSVAVDDESGLLYTKKMNIINMVSLHTVRRISGNWLYFATF